MGPAQYHHVASAREVGKRAIILSSGTRQVVTIIRKLGIDTTACRIQAGLQRFECIGPSSLLTSRQRAF